MSDLKFLVSEHLFIRREMAAPHEGSRILIKSTMRAFTPSDAAEFNAE